MRLKVYGAAITIIAALTPLSAIRAADETQSVTVDQKLQIPGAVLKPGTYTLSIEDRLKDRVIVRVTDANKDKHYLLLSVPSDQLGNEAGNGLLFFNSKDNKKEALRGWKCPTCSTGLEFVYPKLEAAKLTDQSAQSVLAVDPTYDKLPSNLSLDDMKVVTLWLLSPVRITAENRGKGVKAVKYSTTQPSQAAEVANATPTSAPTVSEPTPSPASAPSTSSSSATTAPAQATTEVASAAPTTGNNDSSPQISASRQQSSARHLPRTAMNTFSLALWGLISLFAFFGLRIRRARNSS